MLSVIIKTKNSFDFLSETLDILSPCADIVLLDEHSSDGTQELIQEYKLQVIYTTPNEISYSINSLLNEIENEWVMLLNGSETITKELLDEILSYISNPKKNKYSISIETSLFYLNREIKAAKKRSIRVFRKGYCEFLNNSFLPKKIKGRVHKIKKLSILNHRKDIFCEFSQMLESNILRSKNIKNRKFSVVLKPIFTFLYTYFIKGAIFQGRRGYIWAMMCAMDSFILNVKKYEEKNNDF